MKVGDLVKIKFMPDAVEALKKDWMSNEPIDVPGVVIEAAENACKVMFPHLKGDIRSFLKSSLEVVSEL